MLIFLERQRKTTSDTWEQSGSQLRFELAASLTGATNWVNMLVPHSTNYITHPQFSSKLSSRLLHHLPKGLLPKILSSILPEVESISQSYKKLAEMLIHINLEVSCRGAQSMGARLSRQLTFVQWHQVFVGLQYDTSFMTPFCQLEFWGSPYTFGKAVNSWTMHTHTHTHIHELTHTLCIYSSSSIGIMAQLWALACRTMSFHFFLSATNSLHLLTPSTWRSLSTSSFHLFLGVPLLLVPSSSWVNIFLGILSSPILSRWPNQLILCPFIHFITLCIYIIVTNESHDLPLTEDWGGGDVLYQPVYHKTISPKYRWQWNLALTAVSMNINIVIFIHD